MSLGSARRDEHVRLDRWREGLPSSTVKFDLEQAIESINDDKCMQVMLQHLHVHNEDSGGQHASEAAGVSRGERHGVTPRSCSLSCALACTTSPSIDRREACLLR